MEDQGTRNFERTNKVPIDYKVLIVFINDDVTKTDLRIFKLNQIEHHNIPQ